MVKFQRINYTEINARQKENFNFQKVSSLLADFGFSTYRLTDDWNGADFLAVHIDGSTFLRVQLKGRVTFEKRYQGKDLWVCFRHAGLVYLYPHDDVLAAALKTTNIENTKSWQKANGVYSFPTPPKSLENYLQQYCLGYENSAVAR